MFHILSSCFKSVIRFETSEKPAEFRGYFRAGIPGLEPRMTVPETVVLPITPYPNGTFGPVPQDQSCAPSASARVITLPERFALHKSAPEPRRRWPGPTTFRTARACHSVKTPALRRSCRARSRGYRPSTHSRGSPRRPACRDLLPVSCITSTEVPGSVQEKGALGGLVPGQQLQQGGHLVTPEIRG